MSETADVAIVGAGAAGLAFAWAVAAPHLKVVVLEAGDYVDLNRAVFPGNCTYEGALRR